MKMFKLLLFLAYFLASGSATFLKSPSIVPKAKETKSLINMDPSKIQMTDFQNMGAEGASDMFNCLCVITCYYKRVYELERIVKEAGEELKKIALPAYVECYGMEPLTEREILRDWDSIVCPQELKKKRECIIHALSISGDHMKKWCEESYNEKSRIECDKSLATVRKTVEIVGNYTEKEMCYNPETMSENMKKEWEEKAATRG